MCSCVAVKGGKRKCCVCVCVRVCYVGGLFVGADWNVEVLLSCLHWSCTELDGICLPSCQEDINLEYLSS